MPADTSTVQVPETLDAWRMIAARRSFEGRLPLSSLTRLQGLLVDGEGEVRFTLQFDQDFLQVPYVELGIRTQLPLVCQRSLQRFLFPVELVQRLGLVRHEDDEAGLPPEYEALLVPEDGLLRPVDLVEDELVLAVPVVPLDPQSEPVERDWTVPEQEMREASPFAGLVSLKKDH